jgi:HEAT repeat protein
LVGGGPMLARQGAQPGLPFQVGQGEQMRLIQQQLRRELDIRQEAQQLLLQTDLRQLIDKIGKGDPALLCQKLRQGTPLERFIAIQVVGRRRLPLEKDLIKALGDPDKMIRQAAHDALVRIGRGTDFGPKAGVSKHGVARSVERWQRWLDLQHSVSLAGSGKPQRSELSNVKLIAGRGEMEFLTVSMDATSLSADLTAAPAEMQLSVLERLRDAKGIENTDALASAIAKLSGEVKRQARVALIERLKRMTAATLRDKLRDENEEVRCAAVLACGRKNARELIADLMQLLDDPAMDVVLSARLVLIELTGQDFGPRSVADRRGRAEAADAWRKWWKERQAQP